MDQAHAWAADLRRAVASLPDARLLSAQRLTDARVWYEQLAQWTDAVDEKRSLRARAREARLSASARLAGNSLCARAADFNRGRESCSDNYS